MTRVTVLIDVDKKKCRAPMGPAGIRAGDDFEQEQGREATTVALSFAPTLGGKCGRRQEFKSDPWLEQWIPADHPLRTIRTLAKAALMQLSPQLEQMYASSGRPSISADRLLMAQLLIALYSVRSDRQFCEKLDWNLPFRWFLGMNSDEPGFAPLTFSRNRSRLLEHDVARCFFAEVLHRAWAEGLLSAEHFTVDGTLIESWSALKCMRRANPMAVGSSA